MNASYQPPFGFYLYEYLLIIEPTNPVQKQLQAFKHYFLKSYHYPNAIVSKSHITLMRFVQYDTYEQRIIDKLERIAATTPPFDIELEGFGSFGHTLFVDVKSADPIRKLIGLHRSELSPWSHKKGHAPYFATKPHVTIARNLTRSQGDAIWPTWSRTRYSGTFQARNMMLLKRKIGTYAYSSVRRFHFLGFLPRFTQGKLFA